jgi:glycosyltransferase involved in cell wall biosynthesis
MARVTVLTPTYNRAAQLPRLYDSLIRQTYLDFEWLVVDDGSVDDTPELVARYAREAPFEVRYLRRDNGGKHAALNTGMTAANGEYTAMIDSDDWYEPDALAVLLAEWDALPHRAAFAEVQGLCATQSGEITGSRFPGGEHFDSDAFEMFFSYGVRGDKIGMVRTDVLREFPFPEEFGSVTVLEGLVWFRIARKYKTRGINRVLARKEYLPGGNSARRRREAVVRAPVLRLFFKEIALTPRPLSMKDRYRAYANWIRYARLAGATLRAESPEASSAVLFVLAAPVGLALAWRDRRRVSRLTRVEQ